MRSMTCSCWGWERAATMRMRSPQEEQISGSTNQALAMSRAQRRLRLRSSALSGSWEEWGSGEVSGVEGGVGGGGGGGMVEVSGRRVVNGENGEEGFARGGCRRTGGRSIQPEFFLRAVEMAP